MNSKAKLVLTYVSVVILVALLAVNLAQAKSVSDVTEVEAIESIELDQAELDQLLAPIALYPDTVLSQVLVAATYPMELVQAARWRENNSELNERQVFDAIEDMDWDPSVKALVPFDNLLQQLVEDLNWLQDLGDAFLSNEAQVLASVQDLRQIAYQKGSLSNNKYIEVVEEDDDIVISPVNREVIYVPYYDSRIVYGNWHWASHPPHYWHRPSHYYWHAGLYWSPRVYIRNSFFFSGFHWGSRHVVVHHAPRRYGRYDDGHRRVRVNEYQRWSHDTSHRRGVRYSHNTPKTVYRSQGDTRQSHNVVKRIRNSEYQQHDANRTAVGHNRNSGAQERRIVSNPSVDSTRQKLRNDSSQPHRRAATERNDNIRRSEKASGNRSEHRVKQDQTRSRQTASKQRNYSQPQQNTHGSESKQRSYSQPQQKSYSKPQQRSYSQSKQKSFSKPQQRSYSQPQQRVRSNVQRSSSKVRSQGAKVKQH